MKSRFFLAGMMLALAVAGLALAPRPALAASYPLLSLEPAALDFGAVAVGTASPPLTLTVTNQPGATFTLSIFRVYITGAQAGEFQVVQDHLSNSGLDGGMSATAGVIFHPTAPGAAAAELVLETNNDIGLVLTLVRVPLTGTGTGEAAAVSTQEAQAVVTAAASTPVASADAVAAEPGGGRALVWIAAGAGVVIVLAAVLLAWRRARA